MLAQTNSPNNNDTDLTGINPKKAKAVKSVENI
jgi:hypothetical protein